MPFKKGHTKTAGRQKGSANILTRTVKEVVLSTFNELQESEDNNLLTFAEKYPRDFYQIAAKLIPTEITGSVKTVIKVKRV